MKKFVLICLLAGYGQCFAQNIDLRDLQRVLESPTVDQINQLLAPRGYSLPKETAGQVWGFKSDGNPEASNVAQLYRVTDTVGIKLIYETANPFFYTNLVNQLPGNGFQFKQTVTANNNVNLVFSNGRLELLLDVSQDDGSDKPYRITLQPVNPLRTSLPQQYNHKVRLNSY
jgi:hypothetical protein